MKKYILKDQRNSVYAPYGDSDFSTTVVWNATKFETETEAIEKAKELSKKYEQYIQIVPIIDYK